METSSVLLVCILVTCSVWTIHGRNLEVRIDDQEQVEVDIPMEAGKLPGICWACKWALKKVKKMVGPNITAETVSAKLQTVCNQMGLLKSLCHKFVKGHLGVLIEELTTSDDVKTICVNTGACKPNELSDLLFNQDDNDNDNDEDPEIEINKY